MLIEELSRDPVWRGCFAALPEAISRLGGLGLSSREKPFQRVMVQLQLALEDSLIKALGPEAERMLLCHRGSLDPLAYWLDRGCARPEFFEYTGTTLEGHYRRYKAVIHLVTAADGAIEHYSRYPHAHRVETPQQAVEIDQLLQQVWGEHPCYLRIDNESRDWPAKAKRAREALMELRNES